MRVCTFILLEILNFLSFKLCYKYLISVPDYPVTFRCNQSCLSCIMIPAAMSRKGEVPFEQLVSVIRSLPKGDYIGLSGGEPTISPNLPRILEYIKDIRPDLYTFVVSNGRMFYYGWYADLISSVCPPSFRLGVALYGDRPGVHDYITQVPGSFKQTWQGLRNIVDRDILFEVRYITHRINYRLLPSVASKLVDWVPELDRFVVINIKYTGNAWKHKDRLFVRESDVVPYATEAVDIMESAGISVRLYHFPLCILPQEYHKYAEGMTKLEEHEFAVLPQCRECTLFEKCPRIWKTYLLAGGSPDEFHPVK